MTEEEATQKCCCGPPAVCAATGALAAVQARTCAGGFAGEVTITVSCVGSKCMAWRWGEYLHTGERTGYCGLAGKED